MIYRVKNITNEVFVFEGVKIAPGEISEDLPPEVYQRLLALYHNLKLVPIDESTFGASRQGEPQEEPLQEGEPQEEPLTKDKSKGRRGRHKKAQE